MAATHSTYSGTVPQRPHLAYAVLRTVLDQIDDREVVATLLAYRWTGRPGYSPVAMWRAYIASFVLNLSNTNDLIRRLEDAPDLRAICGFGDLLPPHRTTFNRFVKRVDSHTDLVDRCMADLNRKLRRFLRDRGRVVAVDSTIVRTHARPTHWPSGKQIGKRERSPSDPDADWGVKEGTGLPAEKKKERAYYFTFEDKDFFYGYKVHTLVDANYGVPLAQFVTSARVSDMNTIMPLIKQAVSLQPWLKRRMKVLLADKGYDSLDNNKGLHDMGIAPVIAIRDLPKSRDGVMKLRDGIYTADGIPTCVGLVPMEYVRSDPEQGHLYRCRAEGCHLRDSLAGGIRHCDSWVWEDPSVNIRWFGGAVRRGSKEWRDYYRKRQTVERTFKSMKESRRLEDHCVRGLAQIALHSAMSALTYQATVLAHLMHGEKEQMRWMVRKVA